MNTPRMTTVTALHRAATLSSARQRVDDLRERSVLGGIFYVLCWTLIVVHSEAITLRPWGTALGGMGLAVLAALRLLPSPELPDAAAARRAQRRLWALVLAMAALWGGLCAWAWVDPAFAASRMITALGLVSLSTAFAQLYAVGRAQAFVGIGLMMLPTMVAMTLEGGHRGLLLMMGVALLYLLAATARANREYETKLGLEIELRTERDRYVRLSRIDALSGLANRGYFQTLFDTATAGREPVVLLVLDVDRFKQVNDRFGHVAGDRVIIGVAEALRAAVDAVQGVPARIGGEEFGALLHGLDAARGLQVAEDLRRRITALRFPLPDGSDFSVTASIGIGAFDPIKHRDGDALFREVDAALYKAKAGGRNRVVAIQ
ncbi:MAG: diguanylate cyclase domain-containing protein [Lysobacteraceae bacterium]|jgi:diguanylate cyclase (GGDEF)-like protein|nr:GGDEF domain-containing protein [Silanimonas sp.]